MDDVILDKHKNVKDVKKVNKDEPLDDVHMFTPEDNAMKDYKPPTIQHLLPDWRTAIPKVNQPGGQLDDRRRKCPEINQANLSSKVRFFIFQDNHNSKQIFYILGGCQAIFTFSQSRC